MTNHEELHNSLTYFVAVVAVVHGGTHSPIFYIFSKINDFSPSFLEMSQSFYICQASKTLTEYFSLKRIVISLNYIIETPPITMKQT